MDTMKRVQRDAKMRVGMFCRGDLFTYADMDADFFARLPDNTLFKAFASFLFSPWKFPKTTQEAASGSLGEKEPPLFVGNDPCSHMVMWYGLSFFCDWKGLLQPSVVSLTAFPHGTDLTRWFFCRTDGCAQIHKGLIELSCTVRRDKIFGQPPKMLRGPLLINRILYSEKPADDPPYIGIYRWDWQSERYAQNRPSRVLSNPRKA